MLQPELFNPADFGRGGKYRMELELTPEIRIPVLLVRGASPGKTLVATAAVHGDEYEGVQAIFECFDELDPAPMRGDFLAVPVANPPAFFAGTRVSPLDDGNLARCFPGVPDDGPTAAIAWHLDQNILARADFYLDLHSGGVGFEMPSLAGYDSTDPRSRDAALVSGFPVIWGHPVIAPGRTVSAAKARGIPFLYTEARGCGRIAPEDLKLFRDLLTNLLAHLSISPGAPWTAPIQQHLFGDGNIEQGLISTRRGFLVPKVSLLDRVEAGQLLGVLTDTLGNCVEEILSPAPGVVALIHAFRVVKPEEPLFVVTGTME